MTGIPMRFAVLGPDGVVGRRLVAELDARALPWSPVPRNPPAGAAGAAEPGTVLLCAVGGDADGVREQLGAAVDAGLDVVDVDREVGHLRWLHAELGPRAAASGARVVGAAGLRWAVGDLLVALAAAQVAVPEAAHVAYTQAGGRRRLTPGERRAELAALGHPGMALVDSVEVEEPPGGDRRLAWFPRPVGPSHAAAVPGGEALTVPRHLPGVATVRSYEALSGWRAELLQAHGNLARGPRGQRLLRRRLHRTLRAAAEDPASAERRWGVVAEVAGAERLGRAWAYGYDPVHTTAALAVALGLALRYSSGGAAVPGALAPAEVAPAADLLDDVAERTGLRWSRTVTDRPPI